jgi:bis(5'-nucleosyl)-tetraphosphatase (symmetrical)
MATYAIGDLQGCFDDLQRLLAHIRFDARRDFLWLTGDLVNRGPGSLPCLRFVRELGERAVTVLGNHDLSLLATAAGFRALRADDTLNEILEAPDREELLHWLRHRPLLHTDHALGYTLVHAGLPPQWSIDDAAAYAGEVQAVLQSERHLELLANMYGNRPDCWSDTLEGFERWRFIINCFTRLRFCSPAGRLDLTVKGGPGSQPAGLLPWFQAPERRSRESRIVFGHWSTLGCVREQNVYSLDTGCVWGGRLTAMRLDADDPEYFSVECDAKQLPG